MIALWQQYVTIRIYSNILQYPKDASIDCKDCKVLLVTLPKDICMIRAWANLEITHTVVMLGQAWAHLRICHIHQTDYKK